MTSPLSAPVERETLHRRDYQFSGHRRTDGLFDIEGRMVDRKTYDFPNDWRGIVRAGDAVHDMWVRVTLDRDFVIQAVEASTMASPFSVCADIAPAFGALKGERIQAGWSNVLKRRFGGRAGCTHHVEMLRALGTVAFQTIHGWKERERRQRKASESGAAAVAASRQGETAAAKRPGIIDSCHALAADGEVVRRHYPQFYEAPGGSSDNAKA